ncbi:solute carrier family 13 member 5-like isoform X2 [Carcharodon carcharias]|uniref:solute carrier family 13 member 5-like isoform X2 n=1 Tax=Carcharodon carcharias TaxID=13397 RepID=UPI001B7E72B4|nr:solute carrier family 13 member 5-like isoform X2 [Carcharodon carcharias]
MLSCLRPLRNYRDPLLLAVPVILFMPLPIVVRTTEAYCGYIVLLMAVYWCTEVIPLAITSFLPILLFPTFGIMPSKTVCMEYLKDTSAFFLGGLMVAIAIEDWNLHKRIALTTLFFVGVKPALLMLGFMGVTAFLSMWISNTATTAMMVPIAKAVLDQLSSTEEEAARMALENSRSSAHEMEVESKSTIPDMELSGMASPGGETNVQAQSVNVSTMMIEHKDKHEQMKMYKGLTLCICYAASIGGTATLTGTPANLVLQGQINQLFPDNGDVINFASWFGFAFPNMLIMFFLCWLWLQALFLGLNFRRLWGCGIPISSKEKRAYGVIQEEYKKLGPMSFAEKAVLILFILLVVLWFTRDPGFVPGWGNVLFNKNGKEYVSDATVALFIAFLMFIIPSQKPNFKPWNRVLESSKENRTGKKQVKKLLDWNTVQHKMPWNVVLLVGGGFALAKGCEVSGLSQWLGNQLLPLQKIPHWAIAVILCAVIAIVTECTSNVATATLFLPILASMATMIHMNPLYVMIPTTLSTSFAFMLPVATPPNAIVFSYGHLRVLDMVRSGWVLNVIGVASITLAINTWGYAMFNLNTFPEWANVTRTG